MRCGVVVCLPIIRKSRPFQFHWQSVVSFSLFICLILSCAYTNTLKDNRDPISCQGPVLDAQMVIPGASHLHHWSPFPSAQNWNGFSSRCLVYPNFSGDIPLLIYATEFRQCSLPPRYNSVAGESVVYAVSEVRRNLPAQVVAGPLVEIQYCCPQQWTVTRVLTWIKYSMSWKGLGTGKTVPLSRTLWN